MKWNLITLSIAYWPTLCKKKKKKKKMKKENLGVGNMSIKEMKVFYL